ncbi:MAG: class I SAM-dependent methyltransferase [Pseudobdellovibrio sp.]
MQFKFISINEHGDIFFETEGPPVKDANQIEEIHRNLKLNEQFNLVTEFQGEDYIVESFDHPLQIIAIEIKNEQIFLQTKQNTLFEANNDRWSVDEWDRFNGLTTSGAPFVLTAKAQNSLFEKAESYDDEGFSINKKYVATPPYYFDTPQIENSQYWTEIYNAEENPGWNLNQPAEAFKDMLPRLKLPKSRVLVLGAGEGHDAALFAQAGHVVTAVDFSKEAIARGQKKYGHLSNLTFHESNIFDLPQEWNFSFDLVVEHTCFCAIPPEQRNNAVRLYRRLLHEEGQLMAVFFTMEKRSGPPFGATEWEIRKRTEQGFHYLFWGRIRNSLEKRMGRELFVLAKKKKD